MRFSLYISGIALPMEFLIDIDTITLQFPYHINLMMHFLLWLGTSVSGLNLVLLNVDKLIFFKFPLRFLFFLFFMTLNIQFEIKIYSTIMIEYAIHFKAVSCDSYFNLYLTIISCNN